MKLIITENQLNNVTQKMIDETLNDFRKHCDAPDAETFPDWLSFDDCDVFTILEKIEVVNTKKTEIIKGILMKYPTIDTYLNIYFSTIFESAYFDDFLINLSDRIRQKYKIVLLFKKNELINTNTNRQW